MLRYLTDAYRALRQIVPDGSTDELRSITVAVGAIRGGLAAGRVGAASVGPGSSPRPRGRSYRSGVEPRLAHGLQRETVTRSHRQSVALPSA